MATTKKYKNEKPLDLNPEAEFITSMKREKSANAAVMLMRYLADKMERHIGDTSSDFYLSKEGFDELIYAIVSTMELYTENAWEKFIDDEYGDDFNYEKSVIQAAMDEFGYQLDQIDTNKEEV